MRMHGLKNLKEKKEEQFSWSRIMGEKKNGENIFSIYFPFLRMKDI